MLDRLSRLREKVRGLTPLEVVSEAGLRVRRGARHAFSRAFDKPDSTYISDDELLDALRDEDLGAITERIRTRAEPHLTPGLADLAGTVEAVKGLFPESVEETLREAEAILTHRIRVFGRELDLGPEINWHADPVTGDAWPLEHYTRVLFRVEPGADVRVVWELNRLHHFVTLGRAYALSGDERFACEFLIQLASWYEENPPRFGVNWTVAMEAAIRSINLIAAFDLFRASPLLDEAAAGLILKTLLAHGRFIRANLEFSNRAPSNHYLADLIGLFAIGMTQPDFEESSAWVRFSAPGLLKEMHRQVLPDGVDYEGATAYHRLVLEMFALFFTLSHASGIELGGEDWEKLEAMFEFTRHYLKPDQTAPLIGDSDDARLIGFRQREAIDHSYLMSLGAILLESETFKQSSRIDEEALWWFGEPGRETFESLAMNEQPTGSREFPDSQIVVQRAGRLYAIIDCGDHGLNGRGSHAHSDALSIELFAYDRTFLRDPGTFVYNANPRLRNRFRSTHYHNTARIDKHDISLISDDIFALGPNVRPHVSNCESGADYDVLDAAHYAYMDLEEPVIHRRVVEFFKREGFWAVEDSFTGEGEHLVELFFNLDTGLEAILEKDNRAIARGALSSLVIAPVSDKPLETKITPRWVSLSYGTRVGSSAIIYALRAQVPFKIKTLLIPYLPGEEEKVERLLGEPGEESRAPVR